MVGGEPFCLKFWVKLTPLEQKRRFSTDIRMKKVCYKVSLCENCQQ